MKKLFIVLAVLSVISGAAIGSGLIATDHNHNNTDVVSHSGGTNSAGCHNDYIHGGYHCH